MPILCLWIGGNGHIDVKRESDFKEANPIMCYTSRDYRAEQEARRKREESRERQEAGKKAERPEKVSEPKREREFVRA